MNKTALELSPLVPFRMGRWFFIAIIFAIIAVAITTYLNNVNASYTVNDHAYGRKSGTHAESETEVRLRVKQVAEWWYSPASDDEKLFAGLAEPIAGGPTWIVFYNANRNIINDCYFRPNLIDARQFVNGKGYTIPVALSPIP